MSKILLTTGYNSSKHSLAVLELLRREGIKVDKCIIVNAYSKKRIQHYFRQLDFKEFKKKAIDRIFSKYVSEDMISDEIRYVNQFLVDENINHVSISSYANNNNIEYIKVNSLSSEAAIKLLDDIDLVIYTGGGILVKKFLEKVNLGVLNCHAAKLPEIRGSNSSEWSILLGIPLANTLHFMVRKIDLGPIIEVRSKDYKDCNSINQIRGKSIVYSILDLIETTKKIVNKNHQLTEQDLNDGKQYYTMHPILKNITNKILHNTNGLND
jgi:folate-dependent phosphoribosylglycinamide formyltransferase PurN